MRTQSTEVKGKSRDRRVAQGNATRDTLLHAARELFGTRGYADTSADDIVAKAGVTKGALYHHFAGKEAIFRAVVEQVQLDASDRAVAAFLGEDSWEALVLGCGLWVDAHLDPSVQRILMQDARAVLGWEEARAIENRVGAVALRGALRKAMTAGVVRRVPLRPLSLLLMGALSEACLFIAEGDDPITARAEVDELLTDMLGAFHITEHDAPSEGSAQAP
jgi:AcrR family transcriptional regulator